MATDRPQPAVFGMGVGAVAVCEAPVSGQARVTVMPFATPLQIFTVTVSVAVSVTVTQWV